MAILASGAGASALRRGQHQRDEHADHAPLVRGQQLGQPAQLAPAAARSRAAGGAARDRCETTLTGRRSQLALGIQRLAVEEHLVGHALLDDLAVQRRALHQLGVGAVGGDVAVLEHDDPVGQGDRRQAVGDHERGATGQHLAERRP